MCLWFPPPTVKGYNTSSVDNGALELLVFLLVVLDAYDRCDDDLHHYLLGDVVYCNVHAGIHGGSDGNRANLTTARAINS